MCVKRAYLFEVTFRIKGWRGQDQFNAARGRGRFTSRGLLRWLRKDEATMLSPRKIFLLGAIHVKHKMQDSKQTERFNTLNAQENLLPEICHIKTSENMK